jgi:hypothetical protein
LDEVRIAFCSICSFGCFLCEIDIYIHWHVFIVHSCEVAVCSIGRQAWA